jgi:hypothetical protein
MPQLPSVDVAQADDRLMELYEAVVDSLAIAGTFRMARDSSQRFFDAPGIRTTDKAFAAYVIANAYAELDDKRSGCRWAQQAKQIESSNQAYQVLERDLCQR